MSEHQNSVKIPVCEGMVKGIEYAEKSVKKYEEQILMQKQKAVERLAYELNIQLINN